MKTNYTKINSQELQAFRYSLRHGYAETKRMRDSYKSDMEKTPKTQQNRKNEMWNINVQGFVKYNKQMKYLEKLFRILNKELDRRYKIDKKKYKLEKCYGDACHSKCSSNCSCGWCLMTMGWEALI